MTRVLRAIICGIFCGVVMMAATGCLPVERIVERLTPVALTAAEDARAIVLDEVIEALEELRE